MPGSSAGSRWYRVDRELSASARLEECKLAGRRPGRVLAACLGFEIGFCVRPRNAFTGGQHPGPTFLGGAIEQGAGDRVAHLAGRTGSSWWLADRRRDDQGSRGRARDVDPGRVLQRARPDRSEAELRAAPADHLDRCAREQFASQLGALGACRVAPISAHGSAPWNYLVRQPPLHAGRPAQPTGRTRPVEACVPCAPRQYATTPAAV